MNDPRLEKLAFAFFGGDWGEPLLVSFRSGHPDVRGVRKHGVVTYEFEAEKHICERDDVEGIGSYSLDLDGITRRPIDHVHGPGGVWHRHRVERIPWHAVHEMQRGNVVQTWQAMPAFGERFYGPLTRTQATELELGDGYVMRKAHAVARALAEEHRLASMARIEPGETVRLTGAFIQTAYGGAGLKSSLGRGQDLWTVVECDCCLCCNGTHVLVGDDEDERHVSVGSIERAAAPGPYTGDYTRGLFFKDFLECNGIDISPGEIE